MSGTIDRFIPVPDVGERHDTLIRTPAPFAFDVAEHFPLQSVPVVRAIFWLRAKLLGARHVPLRKGLVEEMLGIGWGKLAWTPGRELVMGAVTEPWVPEVRFQALPPGDFASFREPGLVKIVWTLEAEPLGSELTRFATETRVLATDDAARRKFRAYWRKFGIGIVLIRWLGVPAIRREAERRYRAAR